MQNLWMPSPHWHYADDDLFCEGVSVAELAQRHGTPLYVYSQATLLENFARYESALKDIRHQVCYAVKANGNIALLQLLARAGAGFDIVSGGELERVLYAGGDAKKVVFSGVAKTVSDIERALNVGILCFNVESYPELLRIEAIAKRLHMSAPVSVRVNPDVDAHTHPYISTGLKNNKFGVDIEEALMLYRYAAQSEWLTVKGIDSHIGSQITDPTPYLDAADKVFDLIEALKAEGISLQHVDFGGGIGVRYSDEEVIDFAELSRALHRKMQARGLGEMMMIFEPGRSLVADCGMLVTRVEYVKTTPVKNFLVVDASMSEMIRPALYEAWMPVWSVKKKHMVSEATYDLVGPVCESSDWLARERALRVQEGDFVAVGVAGAYGSSMASNYNARTKPAEVLVDEQSVHVIAKRQKTADLWVNERLLAE